MRLLFIVASFFSLVAVNAQTLDSLDLKIGQMLLVGYPGPELDSLLLNEIKSGKAGSIILFEKNVPKTSAAFAPLKKVLWTYQKAATIPLLICIDQEGGRVNRLKDKYGFPRSITATAMGSSPSLDSVRFYGESIASNLAGLGFNVNFAPCVDLGVNAGNFIAKAGRPFAAGADSVTLLAREYIKQHRKYGVFTVLKHFPGHGSSTADSHLGMVDVTSTWTEVELSPYKTLLAEGCVDGIMSAHIVNKKLDPKGLPGTLSRRVLDSLLRKKIAYNGVVFSDDMQMHAITKYFGLDEAVRLAINGGIDILCFSNNIANSEERTVSKVHSTIKSMVLKGEISRSRIDESYHRIMRLKARLNEDQTAFYQSEAAKEKLRADKATRELEDLKKQPVAEPTEKRISARDSLVIAIPGKAMKVFQIIRASVPEVPILLSVPHCGTDFPSELRNEFDPALIEKPDDTDWFVHKLYDFAPAMGITMLHATYSRWVVDLNRDPQDQPLYSDGRLITGVCPTTTFLGQPLYRDGRQSIDKKEIARRLETYFYPYHEQLESEIKHLKNKFGKVLLWDCHSIRQVVKSIQADTFPDLILGDANETSASKELISVAMEVLGAGPYNLQHNHPFKGGYITRHFGRPAKGVHALQLEMTKINYMDDDETSFDKERAGKMAELLKGVFSRLLSVLGK